MNSNFKKIQQFGEIVIYIRFWKKKRQAGFFFPVCEENYQCKIVHQSSEYSSLSKKILVKAKVRFNFFLVCAYVP
jgi:hypothetical protein